MCGSITSNTRALSPLLAQALLATAPGTPRAAPISVGWSDSSFASFVSSGWESVLAGFSSLQPWPDMRKKRKTTSSWGGFGQVSRGCKWCDTLSVDSGGGRPLHAGLRRCRLALGCVKDKLPSKTWGVPSELQVGGRPVARIG